MKNEFDNATLGTQASNLSLFAEHAPEIIQLGYSPIPRVIRNGEAKPGIKGWSDYCGRQPTALEIANWSGIASADVMLCTGFNGFIAIDVDTDDEAIKEAVRKALPHCIVARFGSKGFALLARYAGGALRSFAIYSSDETRKAPLVEVMATGRNITIPPSRHAKKRWSYVWIDPRDEIPLPGDEIPLPGEGTPSPDSLPALAKLPIVTDEDLDRLREVLAPWARQPREPKPRPEGSTAAPSDKRLVAYAQKGLDNIAAELAATKAGRNIALFNGACSIGWAVHHRVLSEKAVADALIKACEQNEALRDHGRHGCTATIDSGLAKAAGDDLPVLEDRPRLKQAAIQDGRKKPAAVIDFARARAIAEEGLPAEEPGQAFETFLRMDAEASADSGNDPENITAEIECLARMNIIDFDKAKKDKAEALGCTAGALNKAVAERRRQLKAEVRGDADDGKKGTQADILLRLARDAATFFHVPGEDDVYTIIQVKEHRETWPLKSRGFKRWLINRYLKAMGCSPNSDALNQAFATIDAMACGEDGEEMPVFKRRAEHDGKIYLDLCDDVWRAIEIDESGWHVVDEPPVRFIRSKGMLPLAVPVHGGSIDELRRFLNVETEDDFRLIAGWTLGAMRPTGPYAVLALAGEGGTAKTTTMKIVRRFIDPHVADAGDPPDSKRDLYISANNASALFYDNLSSIPDWLSDTLCRVATGICFSTRQLYADADEALFKIKRPILITAINEVITRSDLANRAIIVKLAVIPGSKRKAEADFDAEFEIALPRILGALLDAISHGLRELPNVSPAELPRMADWCKWTYACEGAFGWGQGSIHAASENNANDAVDAVLEGDNVAVALMAFLEKNCGHWKGQCKALFEGVTAIASESALKDRKWPASLNDFNGRLRMADPLLRRKGFSKDGGKSNGKRWIEYTAATVPR